MKNKIWHAPCKIGEKNSADYKYETDCKATLNFWQSKKGDFSREIWEATDGSILYICRSIYGTTVQGFWE